MNTPLCTQAVHSTCGRLLRSTRRSDEGAGAEPAALVNSATAGRITRLATATHTPDHRAKNDLQDMRAQHATNMGAPQRRSLATLQPAPWLLPRLVTGSLTTPSIRCVAHWDRP